MSRLYSEVCVASRVCLRNHGRPLLIFVEVPDRVLSHTPVFERFHLRADTFQRIDKSFVAFHPIFLFGRKVVIWLILIQSHHLGLKITEKTLVSRLLLQLLLFLPLFQIIQFFTAYFNVERAAGLTGIFYIILVVSRFVFDLIGGRLLVSLSLSLALTVEVCTIWSLRNVQIIDQSWSRHHVKWPPRSLIRIQLFHHLLFCSQIEGNVPFLIGFSHWLISWNIFGFSTLLL